MSAGAAGASFVALTQLATRDSIHPFHLVAIGCFSVTLPVFVVAAAIPKFYQIEVDSRRGKTIQSIVAIAGIIFLLGITSLLWTFGWYFALGFVAVCLACYYAAGVIS